MNTRHHVKDDLNVVHSVVFDNRLATMGLGLNGLTACGCPVWTTAMDLAIRPKDDIVARCAGPVDCLLCLAAERTYDHGG